MAHDPDDFTANINSVQKKRRNAGQKADEDRNRERDENGRTPYQRYEIHRADREEAAAEKELQLARQAKVKADIDEGKVVDRQSVITASAKALSKCSQALDAIGDVLERDGFEPALCERVMELINAAKAKLASDLEETYRTANDGVDIESNESFF
jgi:hypothetical protein